MALVQHYQSEVRQSLQSIQKVLDQKISISICQVIGISRRKPRFALNELITELLTGKATK